MSSFPIPNIGAHVSVAGGLVNSFINADKIGAKSIQIFGFNPRRWQVELPSPGELEQFFQAKSKSKVRNVFLHAPYLINLGSPDENLRSKSIQCLVMHLKIASLLKSDGLIFHAGSSYGELEGQSRKLTVMGIKQTLDAVMGADLIIENSASSKKIGATLEEISGIINLVDSKRLKVCLDTAHALASGMITSFSEKKLLAFEKSVQKHLGSGIITVLHANDSKSGYNSGIDRHENIGSGKIGIEGFSHLAGLCLFRSLPWIMEVPGENREGPDEKNVKALLGCFSK